VGTNDDLQIWNFFAAGYAACFDSALVIKQGSISVGETTVNAKISIGQLENGFLVYLENYL
jgi:organic hydroperoxide reductase OsmC/OhrA